MFPPAIPHTFISWLTDPGDVVYDPFSGRGTTTLEANLLGRIGGGGDNNPLAWLLTAAKARLPTREALDARLRRLEKERVAGDPTRAPDSIRMLFSERTLSDLVWLREELRISRRVDRFLLAVLAGGLHGNANNDGSLRGLSVAMPNTFAMAPGYVRRYIEQHGLKPPETDVLDFLSHRSRRYPLPDYGHGAGWAWQGDATKRPRWPQGLPKAKLVFTSPPYLQVVRYGKFNWVRLWLLRKEPAVVDAQLFTSSSPTRFIQFIRATLRQTERILRPDGYVVMVLGDVRRGDEQLNVAQLVREHCVASTHLRVLSELEDPIPIKHKVSRIWRESRGRATRTDRMLILGGSDIHKLPELVQPDWG